MFIRSKIARSLMAVSVLSVFGVTSILTADYSFAQRDRRGGNSPRVSGQQDTRGGQSPRVSRQQGRRGDKSSRVSRQQGRRSGTSSRVSRQQGRRSGTSSRVIPGGIEGHGIIRCHTFITAEFSTGIPGPGSLL
jgi:hypothetical protein